MLPDFIKPENVLFKGEDVNAGIIIIFSESPVSGTGYEPDRRDFSLMHVIDGEDPNEASRVDNLTEKEAVDLLAVWLKGELEIE
jgi:hypothetical protein